jgi:putative phosphoesterase
LKNDTLLRIGLISDTHGLLRPQAVAALQGVDHIIHAGDIGTPRILEQLGQIAPVMAVRGNNDQAPWASEIPVSQTVKMNGVAIHVLHDVHELAFDPAASGVQVVIAGHSHKPAIDIRNGVLFINPGSAGPRRFKLPVSVATLDLCGGMPDAQIRILEA